MARLRPPVSVIHFIDSLYPHLSKDEYSSSCPLLLTPAPWKVVSFTRTFLSWKRSPPPKRHTQNSTIIDKFRFLPFHQIKLPSQKKIFSSMNIPAALAGSRKAPIGLFERRPLPSDGISFFTKKGAHESTLNKYTGWVVLLSNKGESGLWRVLFSIVLDCEIREKSSKQYLVLKKGYCTMRFEPAIDDERIAQESAI
ncbi:MAG: hypothetical protein Q9174_007262 [Haloplaca sp. 1 TL-2023]